MTTLQRRRRKRGWSLAELATQLGCSVSHLSMVETGKREPSDRFIAALATTYGVRPETVARWIG